jgi:hypothetical protein
MEIHPRIRQRICRNRAAREAEIQNSRLAAVANLDAVLGYLRGANILSAAIDVEGLVAEIEKVRGQFIAFRADTQSPNAIRDAISPHITRIHDLLRLLEYEQASGTALGA